MNFFDKYMSSASFLRTPDEGGTPASSSPASGGVSPAPSSTPSSGVGDASTTEGGGDSFDSLDSDSDSDFDSVDLGTGSDSVGDSPPVAPVVPPVVAPAVTPPVAPVTPPVAAPVAAVPVKGPDSPSSPVDTLFENLNTNGPALQDWLAENSFKLTKEEADAFELDAVSMIPKMMAKVQVASMKMTMNLLKNLVPGMIDNRTATTSATQTKAKEAISEFFTSNPDLNAKDHQTLVDKWAKAFRSQNPSAPRSEAIKFVASAIRTELGLAAPALGAVPTKVAPFVPARPGAKTPIQTTPIESPFAGLGMEIDD